MSNVIDALLLIIENPRAKKGYSDLKKYYEERNMAQEAMAIDHLIMERIGREAHSTPNYKKQ